MKVTNERLIQSIILILIGVVQAQVTLLPLALKPLPLGSIKPSGWLQSTLKASASGLAGHEHDFYKWVSDSSWTGGHSEYSDLNEGLPYWFNGMVPMAYALDDQRLKTQVHTVAEYILSHQTDDGWIGPESKTSRIFWGRFPLFLGMTQLADANETWTKEIVDRMYRFNNLMHEMMADNHTGYVYQEGDSNDDYGWGQARYQDMIISLMWLYENHPGNRTQLEQLVDNMNSLNDFGVKWESWYTEPTYITTDVSTLPSEEVKAINYMYLHGVNIGQSLKAPAVVRRFSHNESLAETAMKSVNWTMTYHGSPAGTILADEEMVGLSPFSGGELCTHVETMFSLSYNYQALGDGYCADQAERTAFNALPASMTGDWWAHQYMLQSNQPWSRMMTARVFSNVNPYGQTFGLEPNYPCCAVNHPQGIPKYLSNSYLTIGNNGLVHGLLGPASVRTRLESGTVSVDCQTNYPFGDILIYTINSDAAFDFYVRVPAWADQSSTTINHRPVSPDSKSMLHKTSIGSGSTTLTYKLTTSVRASPRSNDTVSIYHGALLYSLHITSANETWPPHLYNNPTQAYGSEYSEAGAVDYRYITNTSAWNYAIDIASLVFHNPSNGSVDGLPGLIFEEGAPPVYITAKGCQIDWPLFQDTIPDIVPKKENRNCIGPVEELRLVPFGSAKIHMAEFPTVDLSGNQETGSGTGETNSNSTQQSAGWRLSPIQKRVMICLTLGATVFVF